MKFMAAMVACVMLPGILQADEKDRDAQLEAQKAMPGYQPPPVVTELKLMSLVNKFEDLDPTHFRHAVAFVKVIHRPKPDVEIAIAAAIEAVADYLPARGRDGRHPAKARKGGF